MALLYVNLCINREIISADYEGIVRGQSWVVGSGVEAQGSREPCGMWFLNPTLPLFYSFLICNQGW